MRTLPILLLLLMMVGSLFAADPKSKTDQPSQEKKAGQSDSLTYPEDLKRSSPALELADSSKTPPVLQEYVEVNATAFPGLNLELPGLKKRVAFSAMPVPKPAHDERYYQNGGLILAYWGIPMRSSGELVSTTAATPPWK